MDELVLDGAEIVLEPDSGWSWQGWDGTLSLTSREKGFSIDDRPVATESDLEPLGPQLAGKVYTATGFADTPGVCGHGQLLALAATLSRATEIGGQPALLRSSEGTFQLNVATPSTKVTPSGPVSDPVSLKTGRWSFRTSGQEQRAVSD